MDRVCGTSPVRDACCKRGGSDRTVFDGWPRGGTNSLSLNSRITFDGCFLTRTKVAGAPNNAFNVRYFSLSARYRSRLRWDFDDECIMMRSGACRRRREVRVHGAAKHFPSLTPCPLSCLNFASKATKSTCTVSSSRATKLALSVRSRIVRYEYYTLLC